MNKKIRCLECGQDLGCITVQHLKNCCGMTTEEYKQKHPQAKTISEYIKYKRKQNCQRINNQISKFYCIECGVNYTEKAISNHWNYTCEDCKNPKYPGKIYLPDKDLVICQICWKAMEQISWMHTRLHNITLHEYRNKFPEVWVTNKRIREERKKRHLGENNPTKRKDVRASMSRSQIYTATKYIIKYPWIFSKIEKIRDHLGVIEVKCKKCEKWFTPTGNQLQERIRALSHGSDGQYMYCSEECKGTCPLYRLNPLEYLKDSFEKQYTDSEYQIFRYEVLKRQVNQYGYNFCEICEVTENLHVHHEKPQKTHPTMSLDPDNGIVLCEDCHLKKVHSGSCSTSHLANKIC